MAQGAQAIPAAPAPVKFTTLSKEYIHLGGTMFAGTESIVVAQQWLKKLERIFTGLEITDAQMRQLASWQLHGAASNWWESVTSRVDENTITWAQFRYIVIQFPNPKFLAVFSTYVHSFFQTRDAFVAKWMPAAGKAQLYKSFMDLKQGDMSMAEYERKFDELSKFGPGLIETPLLMNEKFIDGARPEYYDQLTAHVHGTFTELNDYALRYEAKPKGNAAGKPAATQSSPSG